MGIAYTPVPVWNGVDISYTCQWNRSLQEREAAERKFGSDKSLNMANSQAESVKTFEPGEGLPEADTQG